LGQVEYFDSVQWCSHRDAALLRRVHRLRKSIHLRCLLSIARVVGCVGGLWRSRLIVAGAILLIRLIADGVLIVVGAIVRIAVVTVIVIVIVIGSGDVRFIV